MHIHIHVYITAMNEKEGQEFERQQGGVIRALEGRKGKGRGKYVIISKINGQVGKSHLGNLEAFAFV